MSYRALVERCLLALLVVIAFWENPVWAVDSELEALLDDDFNDQPAIVVYDPLEPINRVFFTINDRLYFWLLKPVGKVYSAVLADEAVRGCISDAFHNVLAPVRVVNNLLQGKFKQSGTEVARFVINTVLGAGGLGDPAAEEFGLDKADEDLGQTLGFYGVGQGIYICWPLLGPSSARDTLGMAGDYFLNPLQYVLAGEPGTNGGLTALKIENAATLVGKNYEDLVGQAFDPYVALRDIYYQHRQSLVTASTPPARPDKVAQKATGFSEERCSQKYGNALFLNLARAREYQQCLANTGAQASVNRTHKKGRAVYMVMTIDDQSEPRQQVAMVTDVEGKDDGE